MAQIICEVCGSTELKKQDGEFICQGCGMKYSLDEVRKMMGGGGAPAAPAVVNKASEVEKLLVLARRAREDENRENAEKYYGMVLMEDPDNWEAYFFQIYYRAMQTTLGNIERALVSVTNAVDRTLLLLKKQDEQEVKNGLSILIDYTARMAEIMSVEAIGLYYRTMSDSSSKRDCRNRVTGARNLLYKVECSMKEIFTEERMMLAQLQKRYCEFSQKYRDHMWKNVEYQDDVSRLQNAINSYESELKKQEVERKRKEQETRNAQYWQEHAEEKAALDAEQAELSAKLAALKQAEDIKLQPLLEKREKLTNKRSELEAQRDSLGLFKGKEKKALTEQIEVVKAERSALINQINQIAADGRQERSSMRIRLSVINEELTKPR